MNPFRRLLDKIKKLSCKFSASLCRSKCSVNVENAEENQQIKGNNDTF